MAEKRKTFAITFDKGIDKASLPFEANPARALDALNYVYRDGKVQKRFGFNQLGKAPESVKYIPEKGATVQTNTNEFNGIWRFLAEDGQYHTVAHVGNLLFELTMENGRFAFSLFFYATVRPLNSVISRPKCYDLTNHKSVAVVGNRSLYVLGGNHLLRVRFRTDEQSETGYVKTCVPVSRDNENTYIPTTTISITYQNAKASGRASLDQVNLMTAWRKNLLLSGVGLDEGAKKAFGSTIWGYVYQLDAPIVESSDDSVEDARITITRRKL